MDLQRTKSIAAIGKMISAHARFAATKIFLNCRMSPDADERLDKGVMICAMPPTTSMAYSIRRAPNVKYVIAAEERKVPMTTASVLKRSLQATIITKVVLL